jgi:ATP/maltotriose-dependent transcriptional regulator MalT
VYALSRAREWTHAFVRWCERQSEMLAFNGTCLVDRSEILRFHGKWAEALSDASQACACAARANRRAPGAALYQQGEIHRLRGDHAGAEEAFRAASQSGYDPQPGLALVRMAQGEHDAACAALRRALRAAEDPTVRARLLPALVEVMLASNQVAEAREACRELGDVADALAAEVLRVRAEHLRGALELAGGAADAALPLLRRAFESWTRLDAPYDAARVRVLIAAACRALGDEETAGLELAAARRVFRDLEARTDLADLDRLERAMPKERGAKLLSPREREVLRLIAAGCTNRVIASRLSVSERTVDRHVSNILGKLAVPSRAAATAFAYEHGLL